jgi:hypothetical protein
VSIIAMVMLSVVLESATHLYRLSPGSCRLGCVPAVPVVLAAALFTNRTLARLRIYPAAAEHRSASHVLRVRSSAARRRPLVSGARLPARNGMLAGHGGPLCRPMLPLTAPSAAPNARLLTVGGERGPTPRQAGEDGLAAC